MINRDIDMEATGKLRDEQWRKFIETPTYKQAYELMKEHQAKIESVRASVAEHIARGLQERAMRLLASTRDDQKVVDHLAKTLGEAFSIAYPSPVLVLKPGSAHNARPSGNESETLATDDAEPAAKTTDEQS
ncbi:hypothetical protein [Hyphomonas sp. CY54-11-8]|uniref:hypothetical protein n=1 Tax=Hyphomonas sp. CY54-11-8 TaxID=1280944 RepID=UPI000458BC54|nr:hypothetical protein [Hyphomonas sp. CY54-11-8]KCZ47723.1 hypothetical protein HY17_04405 [Hyphomonas sp. CY54-11-8]